jgi:hypothetical protein
MKISWHYWCGIKNHPIRYVKYLLISIDSLINVGNVNPKDIYVTIDNSLLKSNYGEVIKNFGVKILEAPAYPNYSKQIGYYNLLRPNEWQNDIDKLVQIDCDTIITDPNILDKILNLKGCVNIDPSGHINLYETIINRDGQKQKGNSNFSISFLDANPPHSGDPVRYSCFKDLLNLVYDVDLDELLEKSKKEMLPIGFCYVLSPKELPKEFFKFLAFLNFFFEDDEAGLVFAKFYFNLQYSDINSDHTNRGNDKNIIFSASTTDCFNRLKGIVHFPNKDDLLDEEMTQRADSILEQNR